MSTIQKSKQNIVNKINRILGAKTVQESDLVLPPKPEMGDFSFPCFNLAKDLSSQGGQGKAPNEIAKDLASKIKSCSTVKSIEAVGPYVNFKLQTKKLTQGVLGEIDKDYGKINLSKDKILIEYATPNTHKAFHIGHLRNIITGESIARILANAGYKVIKVNYQGDIGMHVAKCIWHIINNDRELKIFQNRIKNLVKDKQLIEQAEFLGNAYAKGSVKFETSKKAQAEIKELNQRIYGNDESIRKIYNETRKWSLKYFDKIYKRMGSKFDKFYFESETFKNGKQIVMEGVKKGIFKNSQGAIIFEGAKHGLHDRVFINSEGNPTYEGKDMALAKLQLADYNPAKIFHVVSKEQTEYFKVIFKAMEYVLPKSKGKQEHLVYGWVSLKDGKMSSRLGNVILGEWLLDEVKKEISKIVKKSDIKNKPSQTDSRAGKEDLAEKISLASVKYSILKNGRASDISFDIKESINLFGNSGPYLQYTYARIQSILRKSESQKVRKSKVIDFESINKYEYKLIFKLSLFPEITQSSAEKLDPSIIAKYLFELSQEFNDYYHQIPILKADSKEEKEFRLALINKIAIVLNRGVELLGFETVEKM